MPTRKKAKDINEYISFFPSDIAKRLQEMRKIIKTAAPKAKECIGYGIAAFKLNEKALVYFAGFPGHVGLYPFPSGNKDFEKYKEKYKTSKGTIQFPLEKAIPKSIVNHVVKFRRDSILTSKSK